MKRRNFKTIALIASFAVVLGLAQSCEIKEPATLTFSGLEEKVLTAFQTVNVKAAITVTDTDGKNYINDVNAATTTEGCVLDDKGLLKLADTVTANILTAPKVCVVNYTVDGRTETASKNFKFEEGLTAITLTGVNAASVKQGEVFEVAKDVVATGNNGRVLTSSLVITSEDCTITDGKLDTSVIKVCTVNYAATVNGVSVDLDRTVSVVDANAEIDIMVNGSFASDVAGWNTYFEAPGAGTLTFDEGALKFDITTVGPNSYSNRADFMNLPFEQDTNYKVTFKAKASADGKKIFAQTGELLSVSPWFAKFDQGIPFFTLTTEWATYEYTFKHTVDNKRGGLVFEMGKVDGQSLVSTIWFDDFKVVQIDEIALTSINLTVPAAATIRVGEELVVMSGVSATGNNATDYTSSVTVDAGTTTITEGKLDTSAEGEVTLTYSIDVDGITATATRVITIVSATAKINLMRDGSFEGTLSDNWNSSPTGIAKMETTVSPELGYTVVLDVAGAQADWHAQLTQANVPMVRYGIYKISFMASSTLDKKIDVKFQDTSNWSNVGAQKFDLTSEFKEYSFEFTAMLPINGSVQLCIAMGNVEGLVVGEHTVRIDDFFAEQIGTYVPPVIPNVNPDDIFGNPLTDSTTLKIGQGEAETPQDNTIGLWYVQSLDWNCGAVATVNASIAEGKLNIDAVVLGDNDWSIQFFYKSYLLTQTGDYVLSFDVNSANARQIKVNGQVIDLVAGDNHITLNAINKTAGSSYTISAQVGNFKGPTDTGLMTFSNFQIVRAVA